MILFKPANIATEEEIVKVRFFVEGASEGAVRQVHDEIVRMIAEINMAVAMKSPQRKRCAKGEAGVYDDAP